MNKALNFMELRGKKGTQSPCSYYVFHLNLLKAFYTASPNSSASSIHNIQLKLVFIFPYKTKSWDPFSFGYIGPICEPVLTTLSWSFVLILCSSSFSNHHSSSVANFVYPDLFYFNVMSWVKLPPESIWRSERNHLSWQSYQ